jgi:hypothetical protein
MTRASMLLWSPEVGETMELNVNVDDLHIENDAGQSFVGFEANRIAQRRVFEDDHGALIKEKMPIQ